MFTMELWVAPILFLLYMLPTLFTYEQSDYKVIYERMEFPQYNKRLVNMIKCHNFKYNRSTTVSNVTLDFKVSFGNELMMDLNTYKFLSNEYRSFPLVMSFNLCIYYYKNTFGVQNMQKCGNFSGCPLIKGRFVGCNWSPDYTKFPPYIPYGKYKVMNKATHRGEEVFIQEVYLTVQAADTL